MDFHHVKVLLTCLLYKHQSSHLMNFNPIPRVQIINHNQSFGPLHQTPNSIWGANQNLNQLLSDVPKSH